MDRPALIKLLILFVLFAVASCSSMGTNGPDGYIKQQTAAKPKTSTPEDTSPKSSRETVTTETIGVIGGPGQGEVTGDSLVRIKTKSNVIFTGVVTGIDTAQKTISVKSTGKNMTFDLANPVLRGYPNVSAIKTGDTITLGYIRNGIGIVKGENFHEDLKEQTAPDEAVPLKSKSKRSKSERAKQSNRTTPVKVKYRVNSMNFKDVDNNKDGRISPVELGAVIPGLTLEDFKKYDKNGDGSLDETEYRSVRKR